MNAFDTTNLGKDFTAFLPLPAKLDPHLEEALRHVLSTPGNLVRPRIVAQMAVAYGIETAPAKDLAIALEYFHTASLLFDDLPCMDDAAERRGLPCTHTVYGEAGAILAALALINRAYALAWRAATRCEPGCQSEALTYLEQRLGVEGLLDGQSLDLHYSSLPHDRETNQRIALGKTVSLIRLSLVFPAILGGASVRERQLLERIATFWGLSYQIADDLKDVLQSPAETGKTSARDGLLDRPNTALALGTDAAVHRLRRLIALGDRTLTRLMVTRPAVYFLGKLRLDLQAEVTRISEEACELACELTMTA
jgi:geranylgeranyl pyrophosphate synthase